MNLEVLLARIHAWDAILQEAARNPAATRTAEELRARLDILKLARGMEARAPSSYVFIASPYTHPKPNVEDYRSQVVINIAAQLFTEGIPVMSAVAHGHTLAKAHPNLRTHRFHSRWIELSEMLIRGCSHLVVICLHGWEDSVGVSAEVSLATEHGKPVLYYNPSQSLEKFIQEQLNG